MVKQEIVEEIVEVVESDSDATIEPEEEVVKEVIKEAEPVEPVKKVVKKKQVGRPAKPLEEKLAKQVVVKEKIIYMVQNDKGEFEKAKNPKMTARDLKKIELQKEKEAKEIELGKKLLAKKNGKIDNRSVKQRTPAQIEATRKMVEANKLRRAEKSKATKKENKEIVKESVKESVKEVLQEPFYEPAKPVDPYANMIF
jgi:hypothetical protein